MSDKLKLKDEDTYRTVVLLMKGKYDQVSDHQCLCKSGKIIAMCCGASALHQKLLEAQAYREQEQSNDNKENH